MQPRRASEHVPVLMAEEVRLTSSRSMPSARCRSSIPRRLSVAAPSSSEDQEHNKSIAISDLSMRSIAATRRPSSHATSTSSTQHKRASPMMVDQPLTSSMKTMTKVPPLRAVPLHHQQQQQHQEQTTISSAKHNANPNNNTVRHMFLRAFGSTSTSTTNNNTHRWSITSPPSTRSRVAAMNSGGGTAASSAPSASISLNNNNNNNNSVEDGNAAAPPRTLTEEWSAFIQSEWSSDWATGTGTTGTTNNNTTTGSEDDRSVSRQVSNLRDLLTGGGRHRSSFRAISRAYSGGPSYSSRNTTDIDFLTPITSDFPDGSTLFAQPQIHTQQQPDGELSEGTISRLPIPLPLQNNNSNSNNTNAPPRNSVSLLSPIHRSSRPLALRVLSSGGGGGAGGDPLTPGLSSPVAGAGASASLVNCCTAMDAQSSSTAAMLPTFMSFSRVESMLDDCSTQHATMTFTSQTPMSGNPAMALMMATNPPPPSVHGVAPPTQTYTLPRSLMSGEEVTCHTVPAHRMTHKLEAPSHLRAMHKELKELGFAMFGGHTDTKASTTSSQSTSYPSLKPTRARMPSQAAAELDQTFPTLASGSNSPHTEAAEA